MARADDPSVALDAPVDVTDAPAAEAPQVAPVSYARVDAATHLRDFDPLEKAGGVYVARLREPLLVQTPALALVSPLDDDDGSPLPHMHLKLPKNFLAFARRTEDAVLAACLDNKAAWFRRPMDDDALRASFKPFCKGGALKVKLPRDAPIFDEDGTVMDRDEVAVGTHVRCILELSRVCFGRTEFGAMWTLVQAQTCSVDRAPAPRCLIDPAIDVGAHVDAAQDLEAHEFL